jgi:hypothetical protein
MIKNDLHMLSVTYPLNNFLEINIVSNNLV